MPGADGGHCPRRAPVREKRKRELLRDPYREAARRGRAIDRRAAYRSGEVASADDELLQIFRDRRRGASIAIGGIELYEDGDRHGAYNACCRGGEMISG